MRVSAFLSRPPGFSRSSLSLVPFSLRQVGRLIGLFCFLEFFCLLLKQNLSPSIVRQGVCVSVEDLMLSMLATRLIFNTRMQSKCRWFQESV